MFRTDDEDDHHRIVKRSSGTWLETVRFWITAAWNVILAVLQPLFAPLRALVSFLGIDRLTNALLPRTATVFDSLRRMDQFDWRQTASTLFNVLSRNDRVSSMYRYISN